MAVLDVRDGGGSLYAPVLVLLGFPTAVSISTALALNRVTAAFATALYVRAKIVDRRLVLPFLPGVAVGAFAGGLVGGASAGGLLLLVLAGFLTVAGARMALSYRDAEPGADGTGRTLDRTTLGIIGGVSLGVGFLSGLVGIAGAVVIVPFLIYYLRTPTKVAAGTSAPIVICSSLAGLAGRVGNVQLDGSLLLLAGLAAAVGGSLGPLYMTRADARWIRVGFGATLWVFAGLLLLRWA